jgi:hypothetical protein
MADKQVLTPKFSGHEDDFCIWLVWAEAYAKWFDFVEAMQPVVEVDLPANEGPGVNQAQQNAVARNKKAVTYLMSAMPNSQVVNMMAAGKGNPNWPNRAKSHLMIAYLQETYEDTSTLSRVGAKQDLESCVMKKDKNPKILFEKLVAVQFKYAGNRQANILEDDLVTQAIQALPAVYNSTVASLSNEKEMK